MSAESKVSIQEKLGERRYGKNLPNAIVNDLPEFLFETLGIKSGKELMEMGSAVFCAALDDSGIYSQVPQSVMLLAERWYGDGGDDTRQPCDDRA